MNPLTSPIEAGLRKKNAVVPRVRRVRNGTKQRQEQHDHPCGGWHVAFKPMPTAVTTRLITFVVGNPNLHLPTPNVVEILLMEEIRLTCGM